jgi:hypothetical protein
LILGRFPKFVRSILPIFSYKTGIAYEISCLTTLALGIWRTLWANDSTAGARDPRSLGFGSLKLLQQAIAFGMMIRRR